ncbi:hypothetical protein PRIPAC_94899 [Pristionchus pacificus]|uniref:Protein kinase domain-containing protein n=1 Tax=Pristionchus pacificus TaxID=54126 RepID=A0A2A6BBP6_PRIPA|nr:hypothetical protein PRIPAC_94899 [Pristionchus pacificus]|eukprot:PDM63284.1 protein kinase [Pristionchus pacificus]
MAVRNPRELHDLNQYKPGIVLGGRWNILKLLDEGGFGRVYQVEDQKKPGHYAALKIESVNMDGGSAIKLEKSALMQIHKRGSRHHVPLLYRTSKRKNICYMIVTLLGDNLKRLKDKYFPEGYPLRTWSRVAIQCLYALKVVHDSGFVHRDIKACNFMLGHTSDAKKARMVHILDFGLARYGNGHSRINESRMALAIERDRPNCDFRGTFAFAAPSMHDGVEQGRKDDIWSFLYLLIDIYAGLPWARIDNDTALATMKQNIRDEDLLIRMPSELLPIPKHLRTLEYYSRPNYSLVFECLDKIMKKCNVTFLDSYEWETKSQAATYKAAILNEYPGYLEAGPFMEEDPIGINEGPSGSRNTQGSIEEDDDLIKKKKKNDPSMDMSISFKASSNNNTNKKKNNRPGSKITKQKGKKSTLSKKPNGTSRDTSREDLSKEDTKEDNDSPWKRSPSTPKNPSSVTGKTPTQKKKTRSTVEDNQDTQKKKKDRDRSVEDNQETPKKKNRDRSVEDNQETQKKKKKDRDRSVEEKPRSVYLSPYGGK